MVSEATARSALDKARAASLSMLLCVQPLLQPCRAGWLDKPCCVLSPEPHAVHVSARGFMVHGCRSAAQLCCLSCCTSPALRPTLQRDGAEAAHQEQRGHSASADEPDHFLRAAHEQLKPAGCMLDMTAMRRLADTPQTRSALCAGTSDDSIVQALVTLRILLDSLKSGTVCMPVPSTSQTSACAFTTRCCQLTARKPAAD